MEPNLAEIPKNHQIQSFADVGWLVPSRGFCFQCRCLSVCSADWVGGTTRGPGPCETTLLLSSPLAPRDLAAGGCSVWGW